MQFKDYLKLHEVGEDFLSPNGLLARLGGDQSDPFLGSFFEPVWSKNSTPAYEIQENAAARFPETDLKQVLWQRGSGRERPK